MSKIDAKKLRTAAKELNEVLGIKPPINVKLGDKELTEKVMEAIKLINPKEDEFTEVTTEVITALNPPAGKKGKKAPVEEEEEDDDVEDVEEEDEDEDGNDAEEGEEEEEEVPVKKGKKGKKVEVEEEEEEEEDDDDDTDDEEEDEEEEEEEEETSLRDQLDENKKDLKVLKSIAEDNVEFKSIKKRLHSFKKASELYEEMSGLIEDEEEEQQEVAEKGHKKNIADKKVNDVKGHKAPVEDEEEEEEEEDEKPAKKAKATDGKKKPNPFVKNGPSMQDIADKLLKEGADKATIKKEFVKAYKEKKDITDMAFIQKRIDTYMKIAKDKAPVKKVKK
jgi:hypothetical protein